MHTPVAGRTYGNRTNDVYIDTCAKRASSRFKLQFETVTALSRSRRIVYMTARVPRAIILG